MDMVIVCMYKTFDVKSVWCMAAVSWILHMFQCSTFAVPLDSVFILCILWLVIMTSLIHFWTHIGFQQDDIKFPVNTNSLAHKIPKQPCYMHISLVMLLGGTTL